MSYVLPVTLKRFNSVDWKRLQTFVEESIDGAESIINKLKTDRELLRNTTERTEGVLSQYYQYYAQICSIENRIPISEQQVRVSFTWYDVFKEKKVSQYSMNFERANILWNIIGVLTHLGSMEKRNTDDSIKSAAKYFQTSLGVLGMLKAVLEAHPACAANLDLSLDSLNMVSNMLFGAAQECYYDLALKGGKMPQDAISKLAYQVSAFFGKSLALAEGVLKDSAVPRRWVSYYRLKQNLYHALAYYHLAQERFASAAYGEQLSRLQSAYKILENCKKERMDKYVPELTDSLNSIHSKVASAYSSANKDNNTIYFESVPAESKLPALMGHTMAKSVDPDPARFTLTDDPFDKIVPFNVQKADSVYCEKRGELIRSIASKIEENDGIGRTVLAELGLPASLDSMDGSSSIDTLQSKITTIQNEGGVSMLKEKAKLLEDLADKDSQILREALSQLDAEEEEDRQARAKYATSEYVAYGGWTRTPSHTLNAHLRQEAHKFMANFEQARKSDDFIRSKFAAASGHITKLTSLSREALQMELPSDNDISVNPAAAVAAELRQRVAQLKNLSAMRSNLLSQLRTLATNDNIMSNLLAAPNRDGDQALFEKELAKFEPLIAQINATFDTQTQLIQKITEQNAQFLASRRVTPAMEQRQMVLQVYETAFQTYCDLKSHLKEGAEFYAKFQDLLLKFQTKCGDFALARKTELADLEEDLMARQRAAAASAPPAFYSSSPSAPTASPQSSNVQISKPPAQSGGNHPSSIFSVPGGYQASPPPASHQPSTSAPTIVYAMPMQGAQPKQPYQQHPQQQQQQPYVLPPGFTPAALPPGYTYYQPGAY